MSPVQPRLLFLSSIMPNPIGTGTAQRGFHTLKVLRERYQIDLLIIADQSDIPDATAQLVERAIVLPAPMLRDPAYMLAMLHHVLAGKGLLRQSPTPTAWFHVTSFRLRLARKLTAQADYTIIHAFRLSSAPFAWNCCRDHPACQLQLDIDETESRNISSIGQLQRQLGESVMATRNLADGSFLQRQEELWLTRFKRLFVSSPQEQRHLEQRFQLEELRVAPNIVVPQEEEFPSHVKPQPHTLLFVGSFGYYPNRDAVRFFLQEIAPRLHDSIDFRLVCIGYGLKDDFRKWLGAQQYVELPGKVEDITPWYRKADVAVVPLRAGGGTRIKILEAFAQYCPVVSTRIGAEGLQVSPGRELLLADSASNFAAQCLQLLHDDELRRHLTKNAHRLLLEKYSVESLRQGLYD